MIQLLDLKDTKVEHPWTSLYLQPMTVQYLLLPALVTHYMVMRIPVQTVPLPSPHHLVVLPEPNAAVCILLKSNRECSSAQSSELGQVDIASENFFHEQGYGVWAGTVWRFQATYADSALNDKSSLLSSKMAVWKSLLEVKIRWYIRKVRMPLLQAQAPSQSMGCNTQAFCGGESEARKLSLRRRSLGEFNVTQMMLASLVELMDSNDRRVYIEEKQKNKA
ncbi:hypothetical protein BDP27DRAFT_134229 [Rhodocollybia butyracea]|uniref:Uncharacterized protein n=1 Tax=Rhodocollybia butyracea TaxID=206335 RepID=A0A9P5U3I8_9AGAR|nr:hypothetical protein BDP27DRAFT_134229 [Rhodocollybia butyracea]